MVEDERLDILQKWKKPGSSEDLNGLEFSAFFDALSFCIVTIKELWHADDDIWVIM